ncbi:MAG: type I 3-dehydroquinate dehydratase [Candidatus Kariarchaeaceae archaeon]|jgi:3-dehydroquinate dehydratase type I
MICAALYSETISGLKKQALKALDLGVQVIEYRLDGLKEVNEEEIRQLFAISTVPIILSVRSEWNNKLITPPYEDRRTFLRTLLKLNPQYIDLEYPMDMPMLKEVEDPTKVILSSSDFEGMSKIAVDSLIKIGQDHQDLTIRISATPNSVEDLKQLWRWASQFKKFRIKTAILGMGELGQLSRIKSMELGNVWTYGRVSKDIGEQFLPGMLDISSLQNAFSDEAWHLGILANLHDQHFLTKIHNIMLNKAKLKGIFLNIPIQNSPGLDQMLLWIDDGLLDGIYIASPWQREVRSKLNRIDVSVVQAGACNSVAITKDGVTGYNTEIEGVRRSLEPYSIKKFKRIYIEGATRITRSVISAVKEHADLIVVRARDNQSFTEMKNDFPNIVSTRDSFTEHFDLIVNCARPEVGFESVVSIPLAILSNAQLIFDPISHVNSKNALKIKAQHLNIPFIDGWQFLVNTLIKSFELWTKRSIPSSSLIVEDYIDKNTELDLNFLYDT